MHVSLTILQEKNFAFPLNLIKSDLGYARFNILSAKRHKEAHTCTMLANACGMRYSSCFDARIPKHRHTLTRILTWCATALGQFTAQARRRRLQVKRESSRNYFVQCPQALNSWSDGPCQGYHVAIGALSSGAEEARAIISSGITPAALLAPATRTGSETEQD